MIVHRKKTTVMIALLLILFTINLVEGKFHFASFVPCTDI